MAGRFSVEATFRAVDRITQPVSRMQRSVLKFTRRAQAGLKRMDRMADRVSRTLATGLRRGLTAATAAIGATVFETNRLANEADELGKRTRELDFPIEEFQQWKFAAGQAGIESQTFNKSLEAMTRRLGQAEAGTGTMFTRLKELNPELLENMLNAGSTSEALEKYHQAMREIEDPTRRAAITASIFSNSGQNMQRMADLSSDKLQQLMKTQMENGVVTREQATAAEEYNDRTDDLMKTLTGLRRDVLLPLLPVFTDLVVGARDWVQANREIITTGIQDFFEGVSENIENIITWMMRIGVTIGVWFALHAILKILIAAFTVFNLVMAANPITLIVVGVIALVAALATLGSWLMQTLGIADGWGDGFKVIIEAIGDAFAWLGGYIMNSIRGWVSLFQGVGEAIIGVFTIVSKTIGTIFGSIGALLRGDWDAFLEYWRTLWADIKSIFTGVMETIQPFIDMISDRISGLISGAKALIGLVPGFGDDDDDDDQATTSRGKFGLRGPQTPMTTPQERIAREFEERRTVDESFVTIRDETGRAEQDDRGGRGRVRVVPTGGF